MTKPTKKTIAHWPKIRIVSENETSKISRIAYSLSDAWYEVEIQGVPIGGCYKTEQEASAVRDAAVFELLTRKAA
jgi:hypothetical protein